MDAAMFGSVTRRILGFAPAIGVGLYRTLRFSWVWSRRAFAVFSLTVGALFAWKALDPPDPIVASEATTLITRPLRDDGVPDFVAAYLAAQRDGVTPATNAVIPFWQAMGCREIPAELRAEFFEEIGCETLPESGCVARLLSGSTHESLRHWLEETSEGRLAESESARCVRVVLDCVYSRHGTVERVPPLTEWLAENTSGIALLRRSAAMPGYYSPSPELLTDPPAAIWDGTADDVLLHREAAAMLAVSATARVDDGSAARIARLGASLGLANHLISPNRLLFSSLRGGQDVEIGLRCWLLTADRCEDDGFLKQMLERLNAYSPVRWVDGSVLDHEATASLDAITRAMRGDAPHEVGEQFGQLVKRPLLYDPNVILRAVADRFREAARIAAIVDRNERRRQAGDFDRDLEREVVDEAQLGALVGVLAVVSRARFDRGCELVFAAELVPRLRAAVAAEDVQVARHRLATVAIAARQRRLETGRYPGTLSELAGTIRPEAITDPLSGLPFRYERRGDGFVLYSVGANGVDDGASDRFGDFVDGEHAPIDWLDTRVVEEGVDDLVVRLPIPEFEAPTPEDFERRYFENWPNPERPTQTDQRE